MAKRKAQGVGRLTGVLAAGLLGGVLLGVGCAPTLPPGESGEVIAQLQGRVAELEQELAQQVAQRDALLKEREALRSRIASLEEELYSQQKRREGIKFILFEGDIIYGVDAKSFLFFREALRLRALRDAAFAEAFSQFEQSAGGDTQVLFLLKEVDSSRDRFLSGAEIDAFRKAEERIFYEPDGNSK